MSAIKNNTVIILLLGAGHGLNDMIAGYFLGSLVQVRADMLQISLGLFIYNLLAFGGQYPVALLLEKIRNPKNMLLIAYGLNIAALIFFSLIPQLSIVLAGVASAMYHVAGGTICAKKNKAMNIGLFAAPGVAGLIAGGYVAYEKIFVSYWLISAAILILVSLVFLSIRSHKLYAVPGQDTTSNKKFQLDQHDLVMILLLTIISLRSVVWDVFQLIHQNNYGWLIAIAAAAFIGKIAGGWIADRIGWRLYTFLALGFATPLLTFFRNEILLFCIGIGLLQSSIPSTTALLIQSLKGKTERAIGLSFGTTIMAGAILFYTPVRTALLSNFFIWITGALMLFLLYIAYRKETRSAL
ncbi:MAG TPA: MFS transporter [Chitinophagaceae bacterium]|jgi:FSR family fosmidomycin resistance protein-like MFS transporter|nr:MFS transporter [Chitinophagaceae bacterium]